MFLNFVGNIFYVNIFAEAFMEELAKTAEHKISKTYRKDIWRPFIAAINNIIY